MGTQRRHYSDEFKIESVKLLTDQGLSIAAASRDLGVTGSLLGRGKRAYEEDLLGDTPTCREAEELTALRKKNKRLRMERDIFCVVPR